MTTFGFDREGARRVVDAVRQVEGADMQSRAPQYRRAARTVGPHSHIVGKVTAIDGSDYTLLSVTEQYWSSGGLVDIPNARVWDGESDNLPKVKAVDGRPRAVGDFVMLGHRWGEGNQSTWYVVPEKFFVEVDVSIAGGSNGVYNVSAPTWTYNVDTKAGDRLVSNVAPMNNRALNGYTSATEGWAYFDGTDWKLGWVNEEQDESPPGGGGSDGQGYEVIRYNNGAVDAETDGGVLDFDDQATPGAGNAKVEWTLTGGLDEGGGGNKRTMIEGVVDVSSVPGADGHGYEVIEVNDVQVDAETDGGVLNFNDTSNSGTTLGVEFSGAVDGGNAQQSNITATVDASGIVTSDGDGENAVHRTFWVVVENGAATATVNLDSAIDWRGRHIESGAIHRYDGTEASALTATTWSIKESIGGANTLGANRATATSIAVGSGYELKVSAAGVLQFTGVDVGAADQNYYITITVSDRITASTHTIS